MSLFRQFYLPKDFKVDYMALHKLQPSKYGTVSVFIKGLEEYTTNEVGRKYISYGVSPEFKDTGKSYMFNNQRKDIPEQLDAYLKFARTIDDRFNNVYVNWYNSGLDYIAPHSDCIDSLIPGSSILIINLNESAYCRTLHITHKVEEEYYQSITLTDRLCILLDAAEQQQYRHSINLEPTMQGRISITFRSVQQ